MYQRIRIVAVLLFLLVVKSLFSAEIVKVPSGTSGDPGIIQSTLDNLQEWDTLKYMGI